MKRVILLSGMSLLATVSFSQQVSSKRSGAVEPVENKELVETVASDSVVTIHSMARDGKPITVLVAKELQQNTGKVVEAVTPASSAKKPD